MKKLLWPNTYKTKIVPVIRSVRMGVSIGVVGKEIREYQLENQVALPYRGTIHDIGRAMTHKKIIVGLYPQNIPTPDIARITGHTEEACDRYIKAFKKVRTLYVT